MHARGPDRLTVFFDAECALCARLRDWVEQQPQLVPIDFAPAQDPGTCPVEPDELLAELTVVGSDGALWRGTNAWLVCLWALERYRGWSLSLASPVLLPWARRLFGWVSRHRARLGWLQPPRPEPT